MRRLAPARGFTIVLIDPPYGEGLGVMTAAGLDDLNLIGAAGLVVVEDVAGSEAVDRIGALTLRDSRSYGDTGFWLYHREEGETSL